MGANAFAFAIMGTTYLLSSYRLRFDCIKGTVFTRPKAVSKISEWYMKNRRIRSVNKISEWFLQCKYNPSYKYCRSRLNALYDEEY